MTKLDNKRLEHDFTILKKKSKHRNFAVVYKVDPPHCCSMLMSWFLPFKVAAYASFLVAREPFRWKLLLLFIYFLN